MGEAIWRNLLPPVSETLEDGKPCPGVPVFFQTGVAQHGSSQLVVKSRPCRPEKTLDLHEGLSAYQHTEKQNLKSQIKRLALGHNGFIGELYNARTEKFTNRSLFKSSLPSNYIQRQDISRTEVDYRITENISDRFDLLKVEPEIQVCILCGMIAVEGSGKFLTEEKKSEKTVCCALTCEYETVNEKLFAAFDEIIKYIDLSALKESEYTHVVSEIKWGSKCLLSLESFCNSISERKNIEGMLKGELSVLSKLISGKGEIDSERKEKKTEKTKNFCVKVCADFLSDKPMPNSVESFLDFVSDIPAHLKKVNNGKGKPLSFVLIPISTFKKLAGMDSIIEDVVKTIDESFLISIICLLEEVTLLKRNFYDLLQDIVEGQKFLSYDDFKNTKKQIEMLKFKESKLKEIISEDIVKIKSGEKTLRELVKFVEKFKTKELMLHNYEEYLESCANIRHKLASVKNYISAGAIYLGKEEKLSNIINANKSDEFIVLAISEEMEKNDMQLHQNTCHYFLTLVDTTVDVKYVVVDLDLESSKRFLGQELATSKIFHLKGFDIISSDMYGEYVVERDSNFMKVAKNLEIEPVEHRPGKRVVVEIICPGFKKGSCTSKKIIWKCFRCKANIEYDFNEFFYCFCGKAPKTAFECRCSDLKHGNAFVSLDENFLTEQLSLLKPFKELNILILGQSGVGKSTWINSIINYLSYEKFQDAKEGGVLCEIPISVIAYSKSSKKYTIRLGEGKKGELTTVGDSATQHCRTYSFLWNDRYVRLIDTPGLGDTRGIEQDKKNMKNIVCHLGNLKELHGVCILMKANENRINAVFSYCLKELLIHMHKSVAKNVVFCFTNARNSFYTPGQTCAILDELLDKMDVKKELSLGYHNMFCLDNEAFLFLCTLREPEIHYDDHLLTSFEQSWDISLKETKRIFETIKTFKPHSLKETLSLVTARNRILSLAKPLAEISKTIQINLTAIERKKLEIKSSIETIDDLKKKLKIKIYKLQTFKLAYPRTVCTNPSCVDYVKRDDSGYQEIEYKTHCHPHCYLKSVKTFTVNNSDLRNCEAIIDGKCSVCGCSWEAHMHTTEGQRRVEEEIDDIQVKNRMQEKTSVKEQIEQIVKSLGEKLIKYEEEQEFIMQTAVKFGIFLKQNAISVYNDSVADYLEYLIQEEENKPYKTKEENSILENLKTTLQKYHAELMILQNVVNKGDNKAEPLTSKEIFNLEEELYNLELTGKDIKNSVEISRASTAEYVQYTETLLKVGNKSKKESNKSNKKEWYKFRPFS